MRASLVPASSVTPVHRSPAVCRPWSCALRTAKRPLAALADGPRKASTEISTAAAATLDLPCRTFLWRGHKTNYVTAGCGPPVVLVHGFGANSGHYRKLIATLSKRYKVYAVDLLGFGKSDKAQVEYCMELWRDQVLAFMAEFVQQPTIIVGNSIGSLTSLMVAAESPSSIKGVALLNCCGAMNSKGVMNDWRVALFAPLFLLVDILLKSPLAAWLFDKYRTPENIRSILQQVYRNQAAVDDDLVELLYRPSCDPGALGVFVSVITGPPGPRPWDMAAKVQSPILALWGDKDTFVPLDSPVGRFFQGLPATRPDTDFHILNDVGHCPHDDRPEEVNLHLLPWIDRLHATAAQCEEATPTSP